MKQKGFTIVELLIVIVVIAILAAMTIVAYNGIQNRAKDSSAQTTLVSVGKKIEAFRYINGAGAGPYPASLSEAGIGGGGDVTVNYYPLNNNLYYCVEAIYDSYAYHQTSTAAFKTTGLCPAMDGLVLWWPLNGNTSEYITSTNNAVIYGATPGVGQNGKANGSYSFTYGSSHYIDTNHTSNRDSFSFSIWVYPTRSGGYQTPLSESRDCCATGARGIDFKTSYSTAEAASVALWAGGSGSAVSTGGVSTTLNAWNHYAGTYDGASLRFYKNGAFISSVLYAGQPGMSTSTLKMGRMGAGNGGWYQGLIDDIRIYDRALTAAEITQLYTLGSE